jgi:hypothetical protein
MSSKPKNMSARTTKASEVAEGKMTVAKWRRFLELIAAGVKRAEAEQSVELSSYTVQVYLITVPRAQDEYRAAQLEWVRREMDPHIIDAVLDAVASGRTVTAACKQNLIDPAKLHSWVMRDPLLQERYDEARKIQAEVMLDEMIEISNDGANDTYIDARGVARTDFDVVQRSRLRLEQRRWQMSKVNPHRFGDKLAVDQKVETTVNHAETLDAARRRKEEASKRRATEEKESGGDQATVH